MKNPIGDLHPRLQMQNKLKQSMKETNNSSVEPWKQERGKRGSN